MKQVASDPAASQIDFPNLNVQVDDQHLTQRTCKAKPNSDNRPKELEPPIKVARQKMGLSKTDEAITRLMQPNKHR